MTSHLRPGFKKFVSNVSPELSGAQETKVYALAGQVRMDLEPGRIGFMNTQRRENRWQRSGCTKSAIASGAVIPTPIVLHRRALATVGTAPPEIFGKVGHKLSAIGSKLPKLRYAGLVCPARQPSQPATPGVGTRAATGKITTHRSFLPFIPSPSVLAGFHPTLPQFPAASRRWTERYDGKRDLYLQHAA